MNRDKVVLNVHAVKRTIFCIPKLPTKHEETTIELDDLNLHESMSTLLSLIRHMKENKVYLPSDTAELPSWMGFLWKKMDAYDTHDNIKLFIARLVINESKVRSD